MSSSPEVKNVPVFRAESIAAMSPLEREIASLLERKGKIRVVREGDAK